MEGYVGAAPTLSAWKAEVLLLYEYPKLHRFDMI